MKVKEPKFKCGTKKAIDELVAKYNYPYADWMQDWPYKLQTTKKSKTTFDIMTSKQMTIKNLV